jgi:hypothetical protein
MKKTVAACIFFLYGLFSKAQTCDCPTVLTAVIQKTEDNYAGYFDKVNTKTKPRYSQLTDSLRTASRGVTEEKDCYQLLRIYKRFFRDGHFQLSFNAPEAVVPIRTITTDEAKAKAYFDAHSDNLHPLEGIWEAVDGSYRVALIRDPLQPYKIAAVVLAAQNKKWQPGMVKFEADAGGESPYKGIYWAGDLSSSERTFPLAENLMNIPNSGYWAREYPQKATPEELKKAQGGEEEFYVKPIDSQTFYVKIPSFGVSFEMVDSVLKAHDAVIRSSPHLIVDIRDNGGGMNSSFPALLKYLNTNSFKDIHSHFRSTADNLQAEKEMIDRALTEGWISAKEAKPWQDGLAKNQKKIGKMVKYPAEKMKYKEVTANPQKVSVLMNEHCYSSAEYFVFYAKQSKKVTLFGNHTGGMMDYGNVREHKLPCPTFELRLPTTRTGWVDYAPIDNVGFQPDVTIPDIEKDWVKFVINYRQNQ